MYLKAKDLLYLWRGIECESSEERQVIRGRRIGIHHLGGQSRGVKTLA